MRRPGAQRAHRLLHRVQTLQLSLTRPAEGAAPGDLHTRSWPYRSASFSVLGHDVAFRVTDPALGAYLDRTMASLASAQRATEWWSVVDGGTPGPAGAPRITAYRGSDVLFRCDDPGDVAPLLLWWVNRIACFDTAHRLMVHAAVVAVAGRALLLPAPQESGKTTLAAGLVQDGFDYLSDEAAAIDPATARVEAYPKWLSVERGSWRLFPRLRPELPPEQECFARAQWHVDPGTIRAGAVVASAEPAWIITPTYRAGATTSLEPIGRAEALLVLATEAFNLQRVGRAGFEAMVATVRRSRCWRLTTGSLHEAVEAVRSVTR